MTDKTRIFLLRHGETVWNRECRLQGHKDSNLTQKGKEQAQNSGYHLQQVIGRPPRLFCSPLGRCRETAAEIAKIVDFDLDRIEYDGRVKERSFGRWEGQKISDVKLFDADAYRLTTDNRWDVAPPDGESYSMVAKRLECWLTEVQGGSVVLVSHGCAGRILRGIYLGLSAEEIYGLDEPHEAIYKLEKNLVCRIA